MRKLLQRGRICGNLNATCSSRRGGLVLCGDGNFRGALRSVQRGSLHVHVHAEHYRESRSEAHAGQPMNVYFHGTSPLFNLETPRILKDGQAQSYRTDVLRAWRFTSNLGSQSSAKEILLTVNIDGRSRVGGGIPYAPRQVGELDSDPAGWGAGDDPAAREVDRVWCGLRQVGQSIPTGLHMRVCRPREKAEQSIGNEARSRSVDMPVAFILAMGVCRLNASELGPSGERGLRPD
jgi:hypothetical protein